jgi:hypothetical protein
MGLQSALVDQGHTTRRTATGPKVRGETPMGTVESVPFKCRASKPEPSELRQDQLRFTEYTRDVTLLTGTKDTQQQDLVWEADWRIVIEDGPFEGEYEIIGDPTPIRAKTRMLGWTLALREFTGKEPKERS